MDPHAGRGAFRRLPVWGQALAWLFALLLLVGGGLTLQSLASADDERAARGGLVGAAEAPSPSPTTSPSPSPSTGAVATAPAEPASPAEPVAPAEPASPAAPATTWTVTHVVDGDTLDVRSPSGVEERVRLIGIDTPEQGECGYEEATAALAALVLDRPVRLVAGAQDDRDRYGRLLRYVDAGTTDAGLALIEEGFAIARYDSRDGYGHHPREEAYVAADVGSDPAVCAVPAAAPAPPPPAVEEPARAANPWGASSCDPAYEPCVPPTAEVGDLDCPDIRAAYPSGVLVDLSVGDPHRLDGDRDGRGCE